MTTKGKKRCKAESCGEWFSPFNTLQQACSPRCAREFAQSKRGKAFAKKRIKAAAMEQKREFFENDLSWWLSIGKDRLRAGGSTAYWCHKYIRLRDRDEPCIICGSHEPKGGHFDACHFRTRGAAGHLRFNPDNIAKGCAHCNTYTNSETGGKFRQNLVERIGEDCVIALETNNKTHKWTIDECRQLRDEFKAECKRIEKEIEEAA